MIEELLLERVKQARRRGAHRVADLHVLVVSTDEGELFQLVGRGPTVASYEHRAVKAAGWSRLRPHERRHRTADDLFDVVQVHQWDSLRGWGESRTHEERTDVHIDELFGNAEAAADSADLHRKQEKESSRPAPLPPELDHVQIVPGNVDLPPACKAFGCADPVDKQKGPYGGLCRRHAQEKRDERRYSVKVPPKKVPAKQEPEPKRFSAGEAIEVLNTHLTELETRTERALTRLEGVVERFASASRELASIRDELKGEE